MTELNGTDTKNDLQGPDNHDGVITYLEPDILEWKSSEPWEASLQAKLVEVMEFQLSISYPKRLCCESAALSMPANLENSAVATRLEMISFHSNPKGGQCQRMLKLPQNCIHLIC